MTVRAVIVLVLVAAIVVPIVMAEIRRKGARRVRPKPAAPPPPKREPVAKTPLRLVVNKNDMDRELSALLANSRKLPDED